MGKRKANKELLQVLFPVELILKVDPYYGFLELYFDM
jgi:hypothetical protein